MSGSRDVFIKKGKFRTYTQKEMTNSSPKTFCLSVSLLPMYSRVFECLICEEMFPNLLKVNLLSPNQPGFKPDNSCIN